MTTPHHYLVELDWQGDPAVGTLDYRAYSRNHVIRTPGKPDLLGSSDPTFRGDVSRHNPEELLVAALSSCHMLSYLHLCAVRGVRVVGYHDRAEGTMETERGESGHFTQVTLHPHVVVAAGDPEVARSLHEEAHRNCFIASSVNFPVRHEPTMEQVERDPAASEGAGG
ncbi:MAG TPA: OsmC family protein [Thermoplasmata archaeon]|nr:OsmC family protein [Thermoplasmata archaeon]